MKNKEEKFIGIFKGESPAVFAAAGIKKVVIGLGVFDGLHLGHQSLLKEVRELAAKHGATSAITTFVPHPKQILTPDTPPRLLYSVGQRLDFFRRFGIEAVLVIPFSQEMMLQSPETFLESFFSGKDVQIVGVVSGENWHFGHGGAGDANMLCSFAARHAIECIVVPSLQLDGQRVSSSAIRLAVSNGRFDNAARLLGRPYRIFGRVEHGFKVASEELECPTANLATSDGILPPDGVYAAWALLPDGKRYGAAVNIGFAPTYNRENPTRRVEVHLLDFTGNIYGEEMALEMVRHIREERTFADGGELKEQLKEDLQQIKDALAVGIEDRRKGER